MKRISVVGSSGSGKSTVARRLAEALAVPHVELDALHWGVNWSAATKAELSERVRADTAGDGWVVDGNYWSKIGPQVWTMAARNKRPMSEHRGRKWNMPWAANECVAGRAGPAARPVVRSSLVSLFK